MHTQTLRCHNAVGREEVLHIVGIENGSLGGLTQPLATQIHHIGIGTHHHGKVAIKALDTADGLGGGLHSIAPIHRHRMVTGEEGHQTSLDTDCARTRPTATVGGCHGLVEVHVEDVKAHVPRTCHTHDGIEVGAVVVAKATCLMDDGGDFFDILIKNTQGIGVGEHETSGVLTHSLTQSL